MRFAFLVSALALSAAACRTVGPQENASEESFDWRAEPHHISVLSAGTFESTNTAASVGLDYEYRATDFLGVGAVAEYAFADIKATTLLGVADLHLTDQFIIQTGPGVEFLDEEEGTEEEFVYRLGVLYEWERGGYTISPQLHYDLTTGEDAIIFGVAFGKAF